MCPKNKIALGKHPKDKVYPKKKDKINFKLTLRERLKVDIGAGKRGNNINVGHNSDIDDPDLADLMTAMCIFKNINPEIKFIHPHHVYFVLKCMGYEKRKDIENDL